MPVASPASANVLAVDDCLWLNKENTRLNGCFTQKKKLLTRMVSCRMICNNKADNPV